MKIKTLFTLLVIAAACSLLNQCRTAQGLGRDIEHVGNRLESTAQRASPY